MRILHLSKYSVGGAGLAAYRLHTGLLKKNVNSIWFFEQGEVNSKFEIKYIPPMDFTSRTRRFFRRQKIKNRFSRYRNSRPEGFDIYSDIYSQFGSSVIAQLPNADVLTLHAFRGFIDFPSSLLKISEKYPIVWRCPDMNSFTGGCHYDEGCQKWLAGCGCCPQLGSTDKIDLSRRIWDEKRKLYRNIDAERLHVVAQSTWMAKLIQKSPLLSRFKVALIPNGVDTDVFFPTRKAFAKKTLGLPERKKIILFVSSNLNVKRKGFLFLLSALRCVEKRKSIMLITVGKKPPQHNIPVKTRHFNYIRKSCAMALIYNAADCFVAPYFQDHCPNTILEAMSCAAPVVACASSGINDIVLHNETGVLVQIDNKHQLGDAIQQVIFDEDLMMQMGKQARETVLEKYTRAQQIDRYLLLYRSALKN